MPTLKRIKVTDLFSIIWTASDQRTKANEEMKEQN